MYTGALQLFGELATFHPIVVQRNLPEMILKLIEMSSDVKKEVSHCSFVSVMDLHEIIGAGSMGK